LIVLPLKSNSGLTTTIITVTILFPLSPEQTADPAGWADRDDRPRGFEFLYGIVSAI
jgi:hypothetical protein